MSSRSICIVALLFLLYHKVNCNISADYCNEYDKSKVESNYELHRVLEDGLANNSKNLYDIQKARFKHKSESRIACLSVQYELKCISQDGNCSLLISNGTSSECSINVNGSHTSFLWSSFDTRTFLGDMLLRYTIYDLRVFGFEWEGDCDQYQDPFNITILLDEIPCVTKEEVCRSLEYLSTLLPAYSIAQNISKDVEEVSIGYARSWHKYSSSQRWGTHWFVIFVTLFLAFVSKMVVITLVTTYYNTLNDNINNKTSVAYFLFWGSHVTVFGFGLSRIVVLSRVQNNRVIPIISLGISGFLDLLIAFVCTCVIKKNSELLPYPLSVFESCTKACTCCTKVRTCCTKARTGCTKACTGCTKARTSCTKARMCFTKACCCQCVFHCIALFFTFFLITNLLEMVPNILISFYAFPSKTLIHLAFFQVAYVCFVFAIGGTLYLLERFVWICYIQKCGELPEELHYFYTERTVPSPQRHLQSDFLEDFVTIDTNKNVKLKDRFIVIKMAIQVLTAVLGLIALTLLIVIVGIILFTDTAPKDSLQGILTILPTIAIDAVLVLTRKRVFGNKKDITSQLSKMIDVSDSSKSVNSVNEELQDSESESKQNDVSVPIASEPSSSATSEPAQTETSPLLPKDIDSKTNGYGAR